MPLNHVVEPIIFGKSLQLTYAVEDSFTQSKALINVAMVSIFTCLLGQFAVKATLASLLDWGIHVVVTCLTMSVVPNLVYVVHFMTGLQESLVVFLC